MRPHRLLMNPSTGSVVKVFSFAMVSNGWEYFFLDPKPNSAQNMCAIVYGDETEMGDVHIPEIEKYLLTAGKGEELLGLAPPPGWEWKDEDLHA